MAKVSFTKVALESAHEDDVVALTLSNHDDGIAFSGDYQGIIKKWRLSGLDPGGGQCEVKLELIHSWRGHPEGCPVYSLACNSPNDALDGSKKKLFSCSLDGEIVEWDQAEGAFVQKTLVTGPSEGLTTVKSLALHSDGLLYAADDQGDLLCFEPPGFQLKTKKFTYSEVWSMCISPDGRRAFHVRDNECTVSDLSAIYTKDAFKETLAVVHSIPGRAPVTVNDTLLALADRSGLKVCLHQNDGSRYPLLRTLADGHDMIINAIQLTGDGRHVLSAGWDSRVILWDANSSRKLAVEMADVYINVLCLVPKPTAAPAGGSDAVYVLAGGKSGYLSVMEFLT